MIRIKRKNPTDEEFLKKVEIEKLKLGSDIVYSLTINNFKEEIGLVTYDPKNKIISDINIYPLFRRKGIATFIYDYIEKDQHVKLKSSKQLLPDGEKFWQNRLKKQNPTDKSLLSKIQIQKELIKIPKDKFRPRNTYYTEYQILLNGKIIGKAQIKKNKNYVSWIEINKNFQRKGLSTYLYDYIEKDLGIKLRPSINQLDDGKAFWKSRK